MLKQKYDLKDNLPDIVEKNKANIINLETNITDLETLTNYPSLNDFLNQAKDGATGTYEVNGHPRFILKYAGVAYEFLSKTDLQVELDKIETNKQNIEKNKQTIAESDSKYEFKSFDYTAVPNTITDNITNGVHYALISQTPEQATAFIGSETRIIITNPANPADLPPDDAIIAYGLDNVYKQYDNIAQLRAKWADVKDNVALGKIMVLKRLTDQDGKRWVIVKWEDKKGWTTIDPVNYNFTSDDIGAKVRIHWGNDSSITNYLSHNIGKFEITHTFEINSTTIFSVFWGTGKTDKSQLDRIQQKNTGFTYQDNQYPITKFEIWKEA